jgi:hypothetical protein
MQRIAKKREQQNSRGISPLVLSLTTLHFGSMRFLYETAASDVPPCCGQPLAWAAAAADDAALGKAKCGNVSFRELTWWSHVKQVQEGCLGWETLGNNTENWFSDWDEQIAWSHVTNDKCAL